MILDEIKKANIQALKDKNSFARSLYSVFLNKIKTLEIAKRTKGEEVTEAEVVAAVQKMLKELADEKINYEKAGNSQQVLDVEKQIQIMSIYLPKMMTEEEIVAIVEQMEDKSIPSIMKKFKAEFAGKCDMRLVNQIARKYN